MKYLLISVPDSKLPELKQIEIYAKAILGKDDEIKIFESDYIINKITTKEKKKNHQKPAIKRFGIHQPFISRG